MSTLIRSRRARAAIAGCAAAAAVSLLAAAQASALTVQASIQNGVLTASSNAGDAIVVTCDGNGNVQVSGATLDPFQCANLLGVNVTGGPGDNTIDLRGITTPALPQGVVVNGGDGNDTIFGTPLADQLNGEGGNDTITGFRGADAVTGGADGDTMIWNNGDGSDTNDGQDGNDTSVVNGANGAPNNADAFTVKPGANGRVQFDRTNLVPFSVDIGTTERLQLNGQAGDDTMDGSTPGLAALIRTEMNGGDGNDVLTGTDGADLIAGAAGNDSLTGFRGADAVDGGDGDDTMTWNNGDGSDSNDGQAGNDTSVVNGANAGDDAFTVKPNGNRVRFDRTNLVPFFVDIGTTEQLRLNGLGGNDTMDGSSQAGLAALIRTEMNGGEGNDNLKGTDGNDHLTGGAGNDSLTGFRGGDDVDGNDGDDTMTWNNGDGSDTNDGEAGTDTSVVNGANAAPNNADTFTIKPGSAGRVRFDRTNLVPFFVDIGGGTERLNINGGGGDDDIRGAKGLSGLIALSIDGQDGDDKVRGGDGEDVLAGGNGADQIRAADRKADQVNCGAGFDRAQVDRRIDDVDDCEAVNRLPDRTKPKLTVGRIVRFSNGVLRVQVTLARSEWSASGQLGIRRAGKRVGSRKINVAGGRKTTLRIRMTRSGRRLVRNRAGATARFTIRDAAGNKTTRNVRVQLRR